MLLSLYRNVDVWQTQISIDRFGPAIGPKSEYQLVEAFAGGDKVCGIVGTKVDADEILIHRQATVTSVQVFESVLLLTVQYRVREHGIFDMKVLTRRKSEACLPECFKVGNCIVIIHRDLSYQTFDIVTDSWLIAPLPVNLDNFIFIA